jgi:S-disulfanyl-L-cysteine oxidoreductase SoxD
VRTISILLVAMLSLAACKVGTPGTAETNMINRIKRTVTVGNKKAPNPLPPTPDNIAEGRSAFSHYCFACHGLDGQNTGVPFANRMSPPVPSLKSKAVQAYTDGQLKSVIDNGISPSGMPASKGILTDNEVWSIVLYIRNLPPEGSLGEPRAYSGDEDATSTRVR